MERSYVRVPHSYLAECFDLDEDENLIWRLRPTEHFSSLAAWKSWKTRCFGKPVGSVDKKGYYNVLVHYQGKPQRLHIHRIIVCLYLGRDLTRVEIVDHKDRDRTNNKISNLVLSSHSANAFNTGLSRSNTSGHKNISWCKEKSKWHVHKRVNSRQTHIGFFTKLADAIVARDKALNF